MFVFHKDRKFRVDYAWTKSPTVKVRYYTTDPRWGDKNGPFYRRIKGKLADEVVAVARKEREAK